MTIALACGVTIVALDATDRAEAGLSSEFGPSAGIWIDRNVLLGLPTEGDAWQRLADDATSDWGAPNIADQDSQHDTRTFAGALYAVRRNDTAMRARVVAAIEAAIGTEVGGRTLALGRNLTGYVLAADIVGYRSDRFVSWLNGVRFANLDGRTLVSTHEDRPNNWGTHAGAARIASDLYLGDRDDLARATQVVRGYLGDRGAYAGFSFGDPEWQADPARPVPINPRGSTKNGIVIDGAIVDDVRRCECPVQSPAPQENYQWEAMQGIVTQAELLWRSGHHDIWSWSDAALARAVEFLYVQARFPAQGDDSFLTFLIDAHLDTDHSAGVTDRHGKSVGYTGWTHAAGSVATTTTTTIPVITLPPSWTTTTTIPVVTLPPSMTTTTTTIPVITLPPPTTTAPTTTAPTTTIPVITLPPPTTTAPTTTLAPDAPTGSTAVAIGSQVRMGDATGSYEDTWSRGGGRQVIVESSNQRRKRGNDRAEVRWTLPSAGGRQVLDAVIAVGSADDASPARFVVEMSSNGRKWAQLAVLTGTAEVEFSVAVGTPGNDVLIRIVDAEDPGAAPDWVAVDFLQLRSVG